MAQSGPSIRYSMPNFTLNQYSSADPWNCDN